MSMPRTRHRSGCAAESTQMKAFTLTPDNVVTALPSAGHLPAGSEQLERIKSEQDLANLATGCPMARLIANLEQPAWRYARQQVHRPEDRCGPYMEGHANAGAHRRAGAGRHCAWGWEHA